MRWDPIQGRFLVYPGGGSGGGSSTTVNQLYSPEEAARRQKVMDEAQRIYGTAGAVPPPTGATADTLEAQNRLRSFSTGTGQQIADQTAGALKFGLGDVLNPNSNPALQQTLNTATRQVTDSYLNPGGALSQIRSHFGQGPGAGTREAIAVGLANQGYLNTIGDVSGRITSDAYNKGLDTFSRTLAFAPQAYNLASAPAMTQDAVGQQIEGYAEQNRLHDINAPWSNLQNYANIVFGGANPSTQTTATGPGTTNVQRAGMALAGASLGYQVGGAPGALLGAAFGLFQ